MIWTMLKRKVWLGGPNLRMGFQIRCDTGSTTMPLQSLRKWATCNETSRWLLGEKIIKNHRKIIMLWQQKRTELPILDIDFAIENKAQAQQTKRSVTGVFCSNLDLNTTGEKPSLSLFVEIFVWCSQFSFKGLNRARNFHFFFATSVRCITTFGRSCWR